MKRTSWLLATSLAALTAALPVQVSDIANYAPVTADRLTAPEDGNWLLTRRTYDGQAHSPLTQITKVNVAWRCGKTSFIWRRWTPRSWLSMPGTAKSCGKPPWKTGGGSV